MGTTALFVFMQRAEAVSAYKTATSNLGNGMAQQTTVMLGGVDDALNMVKLKIEEVPHSNSDQIKKAFDSAVLSTLLNGLTARLPIIKSFKVISANGMIEGSFAPRLAERQTGGEKADLDSRMASGDHLEVSMPVKNADGWVMYLGRRIIDASGASVGAIVAELSLASLEDFYRTAMPAKRSVALVRQDGVVLVRYPHREDVIGQKIPDQSPWYSVVARGGGTFQADDPFTQARVLTFVRPLHDLPVVVQASVLETDVLVDWPSQIRWLAAGGLLAIGGVVLLLRYLSGQMDRLQRSEALAAAKNEELATARSQFDAALSNISVGVCLFGGDKKLLVCNNRYREIYHLSVEATRQGVSFEDIVDQRMLAGSSANVSRERYIDWCYENVRSGERKGFTVELITGRTILITHQPMPHGGWAATHDDITERRETERKIAFLASHDALTGLPNRATFERELDDRFSFFRGGAKPFMLFMLDLDKFKQVNDTLGHPAGDQLLRETARRLSLSLHETDVIARLGGDEFAIIRSGDQNPKAGAAKLAARICRVIAEPIDLDGHAVTVGASIGIAAPSEGIVKSTDLLKMADLALYAAKAGGHDGFRFFEPKMLAAMDDRRHSEERLRKAISNGEFVLHYQAMIDVNTRRPAALEALVRWRDPVRGLVLPSDFLPLAEKTGLIVPLGAWILRRACADAAKWPVNLNVAVNLSAAQLSQSELLEQIRCALNDSSFPGERLELEMTEHALFNKDIDGVRLARQLKRLGVSIVMDNFGSGHSSLTSLTSIPLTKIKLHRSLISNVKMPERAAIAAAVIAFGRGRLIKTVAIGIETDQQFHEAQAAGINFVQGYPHARPLPASELFRDAKALMDTAKAVA
jgi:diguanylate cyclase (GGDEF)-like protein